jgi:hypothetical protein
MLGRKLVVVLLTAVLFLAGTGMAQAANWDLVHTKTGYVRVTLRAWTKNYNQTAYVANHAGTRISVSVDVRCKNGDWFSKKWTDGGPRFRFVLGGLGNSGRCDHVFRVVAKKLTVPLMLSLWARG